jgi:hypothetical protein
MAQRQKAKRVKYNEKSPREIVAITRLVLRLLSTTTNILVAVDELRKYFPRLRIRVVDDELLPNVEARAYPKLWLIKIRRGIYDGLLTGSTRGRWTLAHELGHVLLQHPGKSLARPRKGVVEHLNRQHARSSNPDKLEREADIFARSLLMPFDRYFADSAENIRKQTGTSLQSAERRVREFHEARALKAMVDRRHLDTRQFTTEFGHRFDLEQNAAVIAKVISETSSLLIGHEMISPLKDNILSAAVVASVSSSLLSDAYDSLRREKFDRNVTQAAAVGIAVSNLRPFRGISGRSQIEDKFNALCASLCALRVLGLAPGRNNLELPSLKRNSYRCAFLTDFLSNGETLIVDPNSIITIEQLPTYEIYNVDHDIIWDDIHEIEYLGHQILLIAD